jgi:hypothetical protein
MADPPTYTTWPEPYQRGIPTVRQAAWPMRRQRDGAISYNDCGLAIQLPHLKEGCWGIAFLHEGELWREVQGGSHQSGGGRL